MKTRNISRFFLMLNATFSLIIGADILLTTELVSEILFAEQSNWQPITLRILGIGLLVFALGLFLIASNRFVTKAQVFIITAMDLGWVVISALLLLMASHLFTTTGVTVIILVAAIVAIFTVGQYVGAGKIVQPKSQVTVRSENGKLYAKAKRVVDAPADRVWKVMTDHPGYADVAANLSKVEVISGDGIGMERRCYGPKGESWRETCDLFEEGKVFGFNVHTEAEDYPYPISYLRGRWSVDKTSFGSEFSIDIEAKPKGNFIMRTLFVFAAKKQFTGVLINLSDAWAKRMEREARDNGDLINEGETLTRGTRPC